MPPPICSDILLRGYIGWNSRRAVKVLDQVFPKNGRQASRALKQGKTLIISGLVESKKEHGVGLLDKLEAGFDELQQIVEDKNRDACATETEGASLVCWRLRSSWGIGFLQSRRGYGGWIPLRSAGRVPKYASFNPCTYVVFGFNECFEQELGLYKAQRKLPFNAFGTMAMAREEFDNNSASSQVFWLLK